MRAWLNTLWLNTTPYAAPVHFFLQAAYARAPSADKAAADAAVVAQLGRLNAAYEGVGALPRKHELRALLEGVRAELEAPVGKDQEKDEHSSAASKSRAAREAQAEPHFAAARSTSA